MTFLSMPHLQANERGSSTVTVVSLKLGLTARYITHAELALTTRGARCGRQTKSGSVCRARVAHAGDTCEWHRSLIGGQTA